MAELRKSIEDCIATRLSDQLLNRRMKLRSGTKKYLRFEGQPVAAVGDNDQGLDMFRAADLAFAPANSSKSVRELAAIGKCRLMRQPYQRGLLEAVTQVIHAGGLPCDKCNVQLKLAPGCGALFQRLMEVAESSKFRKFSSILNWKSL